MYVYVCCVGVSMASDRTVNRTFALPNDLDERFRKAVGERKGIGKGMLSEAISEAIEGWLQGGPPTGRQRPKGPNL